MASFLDDRMEEIVQFLVDNDENVNTDNQTDTLIDPSYQQSDDPVLNWLQQKQTELDDHYVQKNFDYYQNPSEFPIDINIVQTCITHLTSSSANVQLAALQLLYSIGFRKHKWLFTLNIFDHIYTMIDTYKQTSPIIYNKIQNKIKWLLQSASRTISSSEKENFKSMLTVWAKVPLDFINMDNDEMWEYLRIIQCVSETTLFEAINENTYQRNKLLCIGFARKHLLEEIGELINEYCFSFDPTIERIMYMCDINNELYNDAMPYIIGNMLSRKGDGDLCKDLVYGNSIFIRLKSQLSHMHIIWQLIQRHDTGIMQEFINSNYFDIFNFILEKKSIVDDRKRDVISCMTYFFQYSSTKQILKTVNVNMITSLLLFVNSIGVNMDKNKDIIIDFEYLFPAMQRVLVINCRIADEFKKHNAMELIQSIEKHYVNDKFRKFCKQMTQLMSCQS